MEWPNRKSQPAEHRWQRPGDPLVATNDVHYVEKEDFKSHDVLLCIQTAAAVDESDRMRYPSHEFYLKSGAQMAELFEHVPAALGNTVKIAGECNYDYEFHVNKMPEFQLPPGEDHPDYLRAKCYEGLARNYPVFSRFKGVSMTPEVIEAMKRHDEECAKARGAVGIRAVGSHQNGHVDYSHRLGLHQICQRQQDCHPAPAVHVASIVAYTLNITKIDPIHTA